MVKNKAAVEWFLLALQGHGIEFMKEVGLFDCLKKAFTKTKMGLIDKIAAVMGLENCSHNRIPTSQLVLGSDRDGKLMAEKKGYASVIGMLLCLSKNTHTALKIPILILPTVSVKQLTSPQARSRAMPLQSR
jgi:hypothetical protein